MMAHSVGFVLSDFVLDHQVCDCCQKYLSVTPVKVYRNRKIKCGRCSTNSKEQEEENGTESLYNKIAEKSVFKCINRFDGCVQLLRSSEVLEHELTCISKLYTCPICLKETFSYLMISHFKLYHAKSLLDNPSFIANDIINLRQHYLYQLGNHLFFVSLRDVGDSVSGNLRKFSLNVSPFAVDGFVKTFKANFIHFDKNDNKQVFTKCIDFPMTCSAEFNVTSTSTLAVSFCVDLVGPNGGIKHITQNNIKQEENDLIIGKNNDLMDVHKIMKDTVANTLKILWFQQRNILPNEAVKDDVHKIMKDTVGNSLKTLCFQQRNILLNEALKKSLLGLTIDEGATITFTKAGQSYTVTLSCYWCLLIYPTCILENIEHAFFTGHNNNHYYLNCHFCKPLQINKLLMTFNELNNISFFCVWYCGKHFRYDQLYEHERSCEKQIQQKCPLKSCFYYSKLYELKSHFDEQHSTVRFGQLKYYRHGFSDIDLKISQEAVEHILLVWCICVHVKFEWKQPFWEVTISHEIPGVEIKAVIRNDKYEPICSFTTSGSFLHCEKINVRLLLTNP